MQLLSTQRLYVGALPGPGENPVEVPKSNGAPSQAPAIANEPSRSTGEALKHPPT